MAELYAHPNDRFIDIDKYPLMEVQGRGLRKDWIKPTFYPVPLDYFFMLQLKGFWEVHVPRYDAFGWPAVLEEYIDMLKEQVKRLPSSALDWQDVNSQSSGQAPRVSL